MRHSTRFYALLVLLVCLPRPAGAQQILGFGDAISEADMLYLAGETRLSLERLQARLESDSLDYGALWRASRAAVVIGIEEEDNREQNQWLDPALNWATRASTVRPGEIDGLYWRGVSSGRRALNAGPGYAVELAQQVYDDAHEILAQDSVHGGAHNMLGKLNYEVMSMSRVKRLVARTFMDKPSLDDTSWEQAEYHLVKAAEVWPEFVLFHFDVAQLYRKRGRREEAVAAYQRAIALPSVHPTDHKLQRQAREALADWGIDVDTAAVPVPSSGSGGL
jgi:tetratricopeptide (TPR) repeat protein